MQESETLFDNRMMSAFNVPIMFKSVRRFCEMGYTLCYKERLKS